ncbi:hypothetical protein NDU88_000808 [Pleurodeles waltl]|uniref:Uncharacterized protein n=1 Tax=Pleurodeles waltl TaxID=8319 RepID=A0AAV7L7Q4_PLEWA|nr:hypothetical protein NDU88_000808 [Pleurodeles waltl]
MVRMAGPERQKPRRYHFDKCCDDLPNQLNLWGPTGTLPVFAVASHRHCCQSRHLSGVRLLQCPPAPSDSVSPALPVVLPGPGRAAAGYPAVRTRTWRMESSEAFSQTEAPSRCDVGAAAGLQSTGEEVSTRLLPRIAEGTGRAAVIKAHWKAGAAFSSLTSPVFLSTLCEIVELGLVGLPYRAMPAE